MAHDSAALLTPEVPANQSPKTIPVPPSPEASSSAQFAEIQKAVFDLDHSTDSFKLSWVSLTGMLIAGVAITVVLLLVLSWLLK